jgi:hypothetical protein
MDEIDKLLSDLSGKLSKPVTPPTNLPKPTPPASQSPASQSQTSQSIDDLLKQIGTETAPSRPTPPATPPPADNRLLEQLKSKYTTQDQAEELRQQQEQQQAERQRQHEAQQKQQRLEQLKRERRSQLAKTAQTWLKQLDPKSTEGIWFEEFSCNYGSRLEAAIEYLEALQDVDRGV